jgi:hypothetical protein
MAVYIKGVILFRIKCSGGKDIAKKKKKRKHKANKRIHENGEIHTRKRRKSQDRVSTDGKKKKR